MTGNGPLFPIGAKVQLKGCHFGQPGTVLRIERRKVVVLWHDLDYLTRHSPESLMLTAELPAPCTSENHYTANEPMIAAHKRPQSEVWTVEEPSTAFSPALKRFMGGQGANVAQSSGDNSQNREHDVARCRTIAPESP